MLEHQGTITNMSVYAAIKGEQTVRYKIKVCVSSMLLFRVIVGYAGK